MSSTSNSATASMFEQTEIETEELESIDFSKTSTDSIGYTNIAGIRDSEIRGFESRDYQKSSTDLNIYPISKIRDSAVVPIESIDIQIPSSISNVFALSSVRDSEIRNFETKPNKKEIKNEMNLAMTIKIMEVVYG